MATDLVPVAAQVPVAEPAQPLALASYAPDWALAKSSPSWSTFNRDTDEGLRLMSRVKIGGGTPIADMLNKEIIVSHWLMSPYEKIDERTGEAVQLVHVAIVSNTGEIYGCSSAGIRRSLVDLIQQFGAQEWIPPVRVLVRSVKAKVGQMFALEYLGRVHPAQPEITKGKGK